MTRPEFYPIANTITAEVQRFTAIFRPTVDEINDHSVRLDAIMQMLLPEEHEHAAHFVAPDICHDLQSALQHNSNAVLSSQPKRVLLQICGENDGADWHWIVELTEGGFAYIHGGCDYTGWDCQSNCDAHEAPTFEEALRLVGEVERPIFDEMIAQRQAIR
jgi:hypothetical protein